MRLIFVLAMLLLAVGQGGAAEVPKQVLAFYYPWYGSQEFSGRWIHWENVEPEKKAIGSSTHYPVIGAYDSTDPELIDRHMRQMAEVGIDGVIASWWGPRGPAGQPGAGEDTRSGRQAWPGGQRVSRGH